MGTSGSSRGPGSGTSLVPTWLNEPAPGPLPGNVPPSADDDSDDNPGADGNNPLPTKPDDSSRPTIQAPPFTGRFASARGNFTSFAGSGGNDRPALRRAVRDYVRTGSGGSANAASNALGLFRGFQRDGVGETLARLNLSELAGRPAREVFLGLTEVVCKDGGSIDEAIAREAWLETVAEVDGLGVSDLNNLSTDQIKEFFISFIANAVETKLMQEIGVNGLKVADLNTIQTFEAQLEAYIRGSVRDSFTSDLTDLSSMTDGQIRGVVDKTFKEAWDLLELLGDREG
jgi:hypothetical protein